MHYSGHQRLYIIRRPSEQYPKLKKFYDFYNAEYSVYFPNYEFGSTPIIVLIDGAPCYKAHITIVKFQEDDIKLL